MGAPSGITISLPGAESQDAERRRQIALRALSGQSISPQDANAIIEPTESLKSLLKSKLSPLEGGTFVHNNLSPLHQSQMPTACAWRHLVFVLVQQRSSKEPSNRDIVVNVTERLSKTEPAASQWPSLDDEEQSPLTGDRGDGGGQEGEAARPAAEPGDTEDKEAPAEVLVQI